MKSIRVKDIKIGEGMPKICVPIVGRTKEEILAQAKLIKSSLADIVEWRVDWYIDSLNEQKLIEILRLLSNELKKYPMIFTFRTKIEGGEKEISFEDYAKLLKTVAATKQMDFIDVEIYKDTNFKVEVLINEIQKQGVKVIGSNHDFEKTPEKEEIIRRLCYMQELGVDMPKIAVMPRSQEDVDILLDATKEMSSQYATRPIITMSMGELGKVSRVEGEKYGSAVTFGILEKASAPGQIPVEELKTMLEKGHCV